MTAVTGSPATPAEYRANARHSLDWVLARIVARDTTRSGNMPSPEQTRLKKAVEQLDAAAALESEASTVGVSE